MPMRYEITSEVMTDSQLQQYVDRLGYNGPLEPTLAVLQALQFAHLTHIPYENLDSMAHKITSLNHREMFRKMILSRRGGICFELNGLYAWLLEKVGFTEEPQLDMDFVMPCVFCDLHPDSPINKYEKISVFTADSNIRLWDGEYQIFTHGEKKARPVCGEERQEILRHEFGIFTE